MRQPKFLRHLVEKFLLKGDEGNANLQPGIMTCWDLQPIGVTRLPISVMRIISYVRDATIDLSAEIDEPRVWTSLIGQGSNATVVIGSAIPAGTIIQFDSTVTAGLVPTGVMNVSIQLAIAGTGTVVYGMDAFMQPEINGPLHFVSPFMCYAQDLDLEIEVSLINPVAQALDFSTVICLFPNRE